MPALSGLYNRIEESPLLIAVAEEAKARKAAQPADDGTAGNHRVPQRMSPAEMREYIQQQHAGGA